MVQSPPQPHALLAHMGSLADLTRLRLLRLLEQAELGVAELCDVVQLPQSTVSRHLKVLGDQDWVRTRRSGTSRLYRMAADDLETPARRLWTVAREQADQWAACRNDQARLRRLLKEKQSQSQTFFAGAAAEWDKLRGELYGQHFSLAAMLTLIPANFVAADLGCGAAPVAAALAPYVARVIGVDNSPAMLKAARQRTGGMPNVDLRRGDLERLPIEDASCDAALLLLALTYVSGPPAVISEMARILKPGGRAIVIDLQPHDREDFARRMGQNRQGFSEAEVIDLFADAGLANPSVTPLPPEANVKGPPLFLASASVNVNTGR